MTWSACEPTVALLRHALLALLQKLVSDHPSVHSANAGELRGDLRVSVADIVCLAELGPSFLNVRQLRVATLVENVEHRINRIGIPVEFHSPVSPFQLGELRPASLSDDHEVLLGHVLPKVAWISLVEGE